MDSIVALIGIIASFLLGLVSLGWQIIKERKRSRSENKKDEGTASETFANAAKITGERNVVLSKENIELNDRLDKAEKRIGDLEKVVGNKDQRISELEVANTEKDIKIGKLESDSIIKDKKIEDLTLEVARLNQEVAELRLKNLLANKKES